VITPNKTTLEEVAWWMKEQLHSNNLESSFGMPSVYVTGVRGIIALSNDRIIQRGDVLTIDWGVGLMNMYTDMKRMAYSGSCSKKYYKKQYQTWGISQGSRNSCVQSLDRSRIQQDERLQQVYRW